MVKTVDAIGVGADSTATFSEFSCQDDNGYTILESSMTPDPRELKIKYKRPMDVSYDFSYHYQPEDVYKMWIVWGTYKDGNEVAAPERWRGKGMVASYEKSGDGTLIEPDTKAQTFLITPPPGW